MGRVGVCSCIMRVLVLVVLLLAAVVHGHGHKHRRNKLKKNEPRCRVQTFLVHNRQYKTECHEVFERQCETEFRHSWFTIVNTRLSVTKCLRDSVRQCSEMSATPSQSSLNNAVITMMLLTTLLLV